MNDFIRSITASWAKDAYTAPALPLSLVKMLQSMKYAKKAKEMLLMPIGTEAEIKRQKAYKAANFPVLVPVILSGSFHNESVIDDAQIIIVDCDAHDNPGLSVDRMFEILMSLPYVAAISDSIRGAGVYAVIRIKPTRSNEDFHLIAQSLEYELGELGLNIDPSCKNIARKRFFGYHTRQYFRETEPEIYLPHWKVPTRKMPKNGPQVVLRESATLKEINLTDMRPLADLVKEVQDRKLDVAPEYGNYLSLAFALVDTMGEDGRAVYHTLCQHSCKYNYSEADRKYNNAVSNSKGEHTIRTVYGLIRRAGVIVEDVAKIKDKNKSLGSYHTPIIPSIQRRQCDYPATWDQLFIPTEEYLYWRFVNWSENFEHHYLTGRNDKCQAILKEVAAAGFNEIPDAILSVHAPVVFNRLTEMEKAIL